MFKNEFQGGPYFEVFSAQGKDPTAHWKLSGSSGIKKEFDKHVRSFVYMLDGSAATTKIQLPKDARQTLSLIQHHLVLQVCIPKGADFSVDVGIQDLGGSKRRLHFSTAIRETHTTPLHSKIPLGMLKRDLWLNFSVDLATFVSETWTGQTYKSIDSLCISANCRLRRIFTMKSQPPDTTNDNELYDVAGGSSADIDSIPKQCQLAPDVLQATQVLTVTKVLHYEGKRRPPPEIVVDPASSAGIDVSASSGNNRGQDGYHIAFGTKMPGIAQKKGSGREGGSSSHAPKSHSAKTRADHGEDLPPTNRYASAPSTSTRLESSRTLITQSLQRDYNNTDPGAKHDDPEVAVNKESLRTSHTWTDGADGDKDAAPFVKPHPPREPSADRKRRKPRVKSAGKERTSCMATNGKEDAMTNSVSSSTFSSTSSVRSVGGSDKPQPQKVANEEELSQIMAAMQESRRCGMLKSESESEASSQNTSGVADDSLDEVIHTLKTGLHPAGEYEDSDNEDEEREQVFMYSSPPKSAPRHKVKVKRVLPRSQRGKTRRRSDNERAKVTPDSDFVRDESSEEEESMMTRVLRRHPSSRISPAATTQEENGGVVMAADTEDRLALNSHNLVHSPGTRGQSEGTFYRTLQLSPNGLDKSPVGSQSRMSISKKSLREIPKDDVRLSQPPKAYSPDKYAMGELSESSEAAMLQSLRRQTMEEGDSDDDHDRQPSRHSHLHYSDNSLSDSSDDTSMSTLKGPGMKMKVHNYQDEMTSHFLNHSNPRDWGNVFSPPIVLPSQKANCQPLTPTSLQVPTQNGYSRRSQAQPPREQGETDEEDELDLLYDPVLNCYFDPKTCKYYELV